MQERGSAAVVYFEFWTTNLVKIFEKFIQNFIDFSKFANLCEEQKFSEKQNTKP
jgi:hypothetical protein